jgi:hypothetical protein
MKHAGGTGIVICKKCSKVALPKNYGFCQDHRTSRAEKEEEEQQTAAEEAKVEIGDLVPSARLVKPLKLTSKTSNCHHRKRGPVNKPNGRTNF